LQFYTDSSAQGFSLIGAASNLIFNWSGERTMIGSPATGTAGLVLYGPDAIGWTNGGLANPSAVLDVGIGRNAAGVLRVTNGSTGAGQLLLGTSTDTADAQLSVYSQSTTRPSLKLRALSGTSGGQNVFESYDATPTLTFALAADGKLSLPLGTAAAPTLHPSTDATSGIYWTTATNLSVAVSGVELFRFGSGGRFSTAGEFALGATVAGVDTILTRDAANTLAQRNSTNAQTFRIYRTTDAGITNYERGLVGWSGSDFIVGTEQGGTGTGQAVRINTSGNILISSGASNRWQFGNPGHFVAVADNTYDIGANGTNRPRSIYFATEAIGGTFTAANTNAIRWNNRSQFLSPSDGVITLVNWASTDFSRLQFGGTSSSFPAIKRNGAGIDIRLADDSGYAAVNASAFTATGSVIAGPGSALAITSKFTIYSNADGTAALTNAATTDFNRLQFGGTTSSFPALKRSSAALEVRLADDSAYAAHRALTYGVNNACVIRSGAGTPESAVTGNVCDLYLRTDGGANTTLYIKESGTGNTGWIAK
jgi:hypothetical protein